MDFVKSVLDVLGGRVASDCAYAGVVVLLAKGLHSAEGERDAMKRLQYSRPLDSNTLVMHPLLDGPKLSLIGYGCPAASYCTPRAALHRWKRFLQKRAEKLFPFRSNDGKLVDLIERHTPISTQVESSRKFNTS